MSETITRTHIHELRTALKKGVSIEDFRLESSRLGNVIAYVRAAVTATKDDGSPKTVQFFSWELILPLRQDKAFYPQSIKDALDLIRKTTQAIQ